MKPLSQDQLNGASKSLDLQLTKEKENCYSFFLDELKHQYTFPCHVTLGITLNKLNHGQPNNFFIK